MKKEETYRRCEYCDKLIKITSPPTEESYEHNQIEIKNGTILLPARLVENNTHSKDISGIYCNDICLKAIINDILKYPKKSNDI